MQKCTANWRVGKIFVDYVAPTPEWISSLILWYIHSSSISLYHCGKVYNFQLNICNMEINNNNNNKKQSGREYPHMTQKKLPIRIQCMNRFLTRNHKWSRCWLLSAVHRFNNSNSTTLLPGPNIPWCFGVCEMLQRSTSISGAIQAAQKSTQLQKLN